MLAISSDEYLKIYPPFPTTNYSIREVTARYHRNGYNWDIHGTLYTPDRELVYNNSILMVHGSGVNESTFDRTPDGRDGWARVLATYGCKVLSVSYPGQWLPQAIRKKNPEDRMPPLLLDKELDIDELQERLLRYTLNLVNQGIAALLDQNLAGSNVLAFGHSLGGRVLIDLFRFIRKSKLVGIIGFGSHGPTIWGNELQERLHRKRRNHREAKKPTLKELTSFRRLLPGSHRTRFYMPVIRSVPQLEECAKLTGLPREEYVNNTITKEPDPRWLTTINVLLFVGENDSGVNTAIAHWPKDQPLEDRPAYFYAKKFAARTHRTHLVLIPNHSHFGHLEPNSEKIIYLWLWAIKSGYFHNEINA